MPSSDVSGGSQAGYSIKLERSSSSELRNYDPFAASFLRRAIYNGDYEFTLEVTPRAEGCVTDIPVRSVPGSYRSPSAASAVGQPVSSVLWEILNITTYGWSCDPNNQRSVGYYGYTHRRSRSVPPPDEVDLFIAGCSFAALPDVTAGDVWDHLGEIHRRYEEKLSVIKGRQLGKAALDELIGKLEEHFARVSSELTSLGENMTSTPELPLQELLFPGSSAKVEVCTQYASDGNTTSLICATETQTFSLDFDTS